MSHLEHPPFIEAPTGSKTLTQPPLLQKSMLDYNDNALVLMVETAFFFV